MIFEQKLTAANVSRASSVEKSKMPEHSIVIFDNNEVARYKSLLET